MSRFFKDIPPQWDHQKETYKHLINNPLLYDTSSCGTGKTRPWIDAFAHRRNNGGKRAIVFCPKSIMQSAWGDDINKFAPGMTYMVADAKTRKKAMDRDVDVIITNHDAATWLLSNLAPSYWKDFDSINIDESTAFKNSNSGRSKSLRKLIKPFEFRETMTGTPNPNSITEVWHQILLLDEGERLGKAYSQFRYAVTEPYALDGGYVGWKDKEDAELCVYDLIEDITIRHDRDECQDLPANHQYDVFFDLPKKVRDQYSSMLRHAYTELKDGRVMTADQASTIHGKLLQICSGAVYTGLAEGEYETLDDTRTELIMDLVEARDHTLVFHQWAHQRDSFVRMAKKRKYDYMVIDGSVDSSKRPELVKDFQKGRYKVAFLHPKSAGHGLTLTRAKTAIWASPTYNAEWWIQANHRHDRGGQTEKTETIRVVARDTLEERAADKLDNKIGSMQLLLELLQGV